jgi:hypothetical protein
MSRVGALLRVSSCLCRMNKSMKIDVSPMLVLRELLSCQKQQRENIEMQQDQRKDKSGVEIEAEIIAFRYFSFCRLMVQALRVCWGRDYCLHCVADLFPSSFGAAAISVNVQRYQRYIFDGLQVDFAGSHFVITIRPIALASPQHR